MQLTFEESGAEALKTMNYSLMPLYKFNCSYPQSTREPPLKLYFEKKTQKLKKDQIPRNHQLFRIIETSQPQNG